MANLCQQFAELKDSQGRIVLRPDTTEIDRTVAGGIGSTHGEYGNVHYSRTSQEAADNVAFMLQLWNLHGLYEMAAPVLASSFSAGPSFIQIYQGVNTVYISSGSLLQPFVLPDRLAGNICKCGISIFCGLMGLIEIISGYNPFYCTDTSKAFQTVVLPSVGSNRFVLDAETVRPMKHGDCLYGLFGMPEANFIGWHYWNAFGFDPWYRNGNFHKRMSTYNGGIYTPTNPQGSDTELVAMITHPLRTYGIVGNSNLSVIYNPSGIPAAAITDEFLAAFKNLGLYTMPSVSSGSFLAGVNGFDDYIGKGAVKITKILNGVRSKNFIDIDDATNSNFQADSYYADLATIENGVGIQVFPYFPNPNGSGFYLYGANGDPWSQTHNKANVLYKPWDSRVTGMQFSEQNKIILEQTGTGVCALDTNPTITRRTYNQGRVLDRPEQCAEEICQSFCNWYFNFTPEQIQQAKEAARYWYDSLGAESRCDYNKRVGRPNKFIIIY